MMNLATTFFFQFTVKNGHIAHESTFVYIECEDEFD